MLRTGITGALAGLAMLCVTAAPAHAIGDSQVKTGTKVSGPDGACGDDDNASNTNVTVCFKAYGDKLYVKDGEADGRSAYGQFDSDYVYWNGGDTKACRNPYGAGTWVVCDYAIVEGTSVKFRGFTQDNEGTINLERNEVWGYDLNNN